MLGYELYLIDETKGNELIAVLPERRKNPKRITEDSVINWGRALLGDNTRMKKIFFKRVKIDNIERKILWVNPFPDYPKK